MKLEETLKRFRDLVDSYDALELSDRIRTLDVAKDLAVTLSWLTTYRVEYYKKWNGVVFINSKNMSNAAAERIAENEVPELYELRYVMKTGYEMLGFLRSHLSQLKQEL